MLHIKNFYFNPLRACCSVLWDDSAPQCVIVDPGYADQDERERLTGFIERNGLIPEKILLTHGHFDHTHGVKDCSATYGAAVYMHPADKAMTEGFDSSDLHDGDVVAAGPALKLHVIATPGHTPGGVCFYEAEAKVLLSGDTLFAGCIGRTDLPGGDYDDLMRSIMEKLMGLDGDVTVIPGHGPKTSIAEEAARNPFLIPFNEPQDEGADENG